MRKRAIVIGLSLVIFFIGVIIIGVSSVSKRGLVEYKHTLGEPLRGSEIVDMAMYLPYAGKTGINLTGPFEGHEGEPVFFVSDSENHLIFFGPIWYASAPPSNVTEFDITEPGIYNMDFNIIVNDGSCVELYQYRYQIGDIHPYAHLFIVGVPVAVLGLAGSIVGLFALSESED